MSLEIIDSLNFKKWFGDWENNPEAASKVVDQNGRPLVVHHGSDSEFNEFSSKFIGQTGTQHGQGFYFTSDKGFAGNFGKKIKSFFLNIRKPLSTDELTLSYNDCVKLIDAIDKRQCEDDPEFGYGILSDYGDVDSYGREKVLKNAAELEYSSADNDVEIVGSLINASGDYDIVVNTLYSLFGYDGIICPERDIFIIHHPNQAKEVSNTLFNNNSNNMYEGKKNRNIFITESQYKQLINESQESKSIDAAKKLLISNGYTPEQADKFVRIDLRNDIPSLRDSKNAKFILGVTRMFLNRELSDATTILNIDKTIKLLALAHYNEYDRNLNGLSAEELINRFADARSSQSNEKRNALSSRQFEQRDYNIVKINSFEEASRYSNYTSWCVTQYEDAFNSYTAGGEAQFYFCLKNGFENIKPIEGENCPLDEYGLSMIAVCIDGDGDLKTCTCRWNHNNGGNDNIMDEEQISNVVGVNFYQVFKPSNALKEKIEALKNMSEIPEEYFKNSKIKEIIIPNSVTEIGDFAFRNCTSLTSVTIPDSVTSIGEWAFCNCTSLTSVTIGDSVTEIGDYVFYGCTSLTSVTIPDSVTSIGIYAFQSCTRLTSVTIPNSVTSIGAYAFSVCKSLTSVTIPDSVTSIGLCTFGDCTSLTSVTIPDSVTSIGYAAFADCTSLKSVTIPDSVTSIEFETFANCTSLTSVTIGDSVTEIGDYAFYGCTSLTNITIPNSVTEIGLCTFGDCTSLKEVIIPIRFRNHIRNIFGETNANFKFYGQQNESLIKKTKRIFVTESQYKRLKEHAELNMLLEDTRTNVTKKQCLHIIRNHFNNASWLDTVFNHNDNPEGLTHIDYMFKQFMSEFYHNPDYRKKATMRLAPLFCRLAFESNFQNNNPDTTKLNRLLGILNFIYQLMEKNKLDVSKISLDLTYEELNNQFGTQIDQMNKDEDERMNNAQYTENSEYTVIGPVDFKTANEYGNYSCPSSKLCYTQSESTWNNFTNYDENSAYIILKNGWENMEANHDDNSESAYDTYGLSMIFVFVDEQGKLEYCNTRWNHKAKYAEGFSCDHAMSREMISELIGRPFNEVFKPTNRSSNKIEALKNMTEIPGDYFCSSKIKEITIPNNITSIGDGAFYKCSSLKSVTIPDSVTKIGGFAFGSCKSLTSVTIPDSVTEIEEYTFGWCTSLTSVTIPDSVTSIEGEAFRYCTSLTSVTIPDSVTSIGQYAFQKCTSLTSITIPNSVTSIGNGAFKGCTSLTSVTMPIRFKDKISVIFGNTNANFKFYGQENESLNKNTKKIFITESQLKTLEQLIVEGDNYYVDTTKVKIVKKFLDAQFKRGSMDTMGSDGYPKRINIFAMKGNNGDVVKNLSLEQMVDLLEDKFHHIFTEREKRNRFFKQILKDWYNKKITKEGLLSTYEF